ncbi:MAG: TetR/AcrR family transcriptional regulator [Bacilli bacterium]
MKNNQRIRITKELIYTAFLELLKKNNIHQITIRELCDKAGINRTTFYNHYGSQYDVLSEIEKNYLEEIANTLEEANIENKDSVKCKVSLVLQFMQNNLELSKMLINNNVENNFAEHLFMLPKIEVMLNQSLSNIYDAKIKSTIISFSIYGSYKILQDWLNDANRVSPEKEAELILSLARKACTWDN